MNTQFLGEGPARLFGLPLLLVLLLLTACAGPDRRQPAPPIPPVEREDTWRSTVTSVSDGDTFRVKNPDGGKNIAVRVWGIDTPENKGRQWEKQPYSEESGDLARALLPVGSTVALQARQKDRYKRTVAVVYLQDDKVLQEELLKAGLAWVYPQYCKNCDNWKALEKKARKEQRGLWQDATPVPPWEWRKAGRKKAKK
ncbi:thermonuclease family protein [Desulfovibrio sp. OttesenSCG-928-G15]|nr:thermonuclease family protein [Desulfovibrio sp. OttesenSCG-928-G15]